MKLYLFDSCPFCTRVRVLIGLKKLTVELKYVAVGQVPGELATQMTKLTVPQLSYYNDGHSSEQLMAESDEILRFLDQKQGAPILDGYQASPGVVDWLSSLRRLASLLCYPRMQSLGLPEIASQQALDYFQSTKSKIMGTSFQQAIAETSRLVSKVNCRLTELTELTELVDLNSYVSGTRLITIDDLVLFSELRNLTMVKEVLWPMSLRAYLSKISNESGIPLYGLINSTDEVVRL